MMNNKMKTGTPNDRKPDSSIKTLEGHLMIPQILSGSPVKGVVLSDPLLPHGYTASLQERNKGDRKEKPSKDKL